MNSKIFIINVAANIERREKISQQFNKHGISFEIFNAITPATLRTTLETLLPNFLENDYLTPGELSCLASHLTLWQQCIDKNYDYIVIFEDDVIISDDMKNFLQNFDNIV